MLPKRQDWRGLRQAHPVEFETFRNMHRRVSEPTHPDYQRYGGRDIKIHTGWAFTPEGFKNFLADIGSRPSARHSIHRSPPYANYGPKTCKWATPREQSIEQRGKLVVEYNGRLMGGAEFGEVGVTDGLLSIIYRNADGSLRITRKRTRNGRPKSHLSAQR